MSARSAPAKPMAASFLISKAGSSSRRPTAYLALMAGTGRRLKSRCVLARENRGTFIGRLYRQGAHHGAVPRAQLSFGKAMAPVKAAVPPRAKSTILHSKPQKPTPPNGRWPPLADRLGLSFIGKAARPCRHPSSQPTSEAIAPTRFGFHPDDTTPIPQTVAVLRPPPITTTSLSTSKSLCRASNPTPSAGPAVGPNTTSPFPNQNRQKHSHPGRTQTASRQVAFALCRFTAMPCLRPSPFRPPSLTLCTTAGLGRQSQR